jgi:hypothetical protein
MRLFYVFIALGARVLIYLTSLGVLGENSEYAQEIY